MGNRISGERFLQTIHTASEWTEVNPILGSGELGIELDGDGKPQKIKIGDGITGWNSLGYFCGANDSLVGEIKDYAGAAAPNGWLLCNGAEVSRSTYSNLFAVIGEAFGAGDGAATFLLPDLRGKVTVGTSATKALASGGGSETAQLTTNELPSHSHDVSATIKPGASTGGKGVTYSNDPINNFPVTLAAGVNNYATTADGCMGTDNSVSISLQNTGPG